MSERWGEDGERGGGGEELGKGGYGRELLTVSMAFLLPLLRERTYHSTANYIAHRGCHVDVFSNDKIRAQYGDLIFVPSPLSPILLPYHPYPTVLLLLSIVRRVMSYHELQPGHRPQSAFKRLACLDQVEHVGVVGCLSGKSGIVRCAVEEG